MADKDNKSKLTYHVWDKDNNEYDIPDEVVQQRGMDNFAKDFEGGYITMFDDKKQKVDVPIEDVGEYRKQGYIWYDTSGNATPINEVGKKPSPSSSSQGTEQSQYPQEVLDAFNSPDNKPGNFKDLAQLNDEYQRGELKKPSLISQALDMMPKVDAGNIGREQKMGGMITNMLLGDNMQQPQDNNQQVQHSNQEKAPATEQPKPTVKDVDAITGAAPVQQVDAIYNKYVGKGDALSETMYDLMASGQAQNQEEAQSMAMGAMNRAANRLAQRTTDEFVSKLGDTVEGVDEAVMNGWHSHAVQDNLKKMASQYGIMNSVALDETGQYITQTHGYDQFINGMVKPAMVESLVKKYGENYRKTAEDLATRLYSNDEVIQNQLMNQDIDEALSSVISKYVNPSVVEEYNKAQEEGSKAFNEGMEGSQNIPASLRLGTAIASQYEANQAKDPQKTLNTLQKKFNGLYKNPQFLNDMSNAAFKVMQRYGMNGTLSGNPKQFKPMIDDVLKAQLNQLEVKNMIPKGSAEYIMNTGLGNTIVGKITRKLVQTDYQNWLEDIANQQYQPGFWERVGSGALTFAGDAWSYWLPGAAGGKVTKSMLAKAEGRLASDLMAKGMEAKMAERAAKVLIGKSKGMALKTGAAHGAVTFGGQSAISKPIDEIYRTGQFDENGKVYNPSVGKILANTLGEVAKQSAVGAIMQGGTIANMVGKGRGLATNVLADVGGKVVDSSIMTGQQMLERMAHDPNFKPTGKDFAESALESMANLVSIGFPGMVGKYARFKDAKEFNRKFDFNDQDIAELKRFGYDDLRDAFEKLGINGYRADGEGVQMMGQLTDKYMNLMNDKSVPEVLKAKMMAVVEGKRPSSFSPVVDSIIVQPMDNGGKVYLETLNKNGGIVERKEFASLDEAQKADKKLEYEKTLGLASVLEGEYHKEFTQEHLEGLYNKAAQKYNMGEKLTDEDKTAVYLYQNAGAIKEIMDKQQKGIILTDEEQKQVNAYRHYYDSALENSSVMREFVNTFEDSHDVAHGTLRKALESKDKKYAPLVESYLKELYNSIELKREMKQTMDDLYNISHGNEQKRIEGENPVSPVEGSSESSAGGQEPPVSEEPAPYQDRTNSVSTPSDAEFAANSANLANENQSESKASDAFVMGQNAYKNGDKEGLKSIKYNAETAELRLKRAFANDTDRIQGVYNAVNKGTDIETYIEQRTNYLTPFQQEAIRKYAEAMDANKGAMDALEHADDGYADKLKQQLSQYTMENGNISSLTLTDGQRGYWKSKNEYGAGFGVFPDANGQPVVKQVSSSQVKENGKEIPLQEYVNQLATQKHEATKKNFNAIFDATSLKPNDTVSLSINDKDQPTEAKIVSVNPDGTISFNIAGSKNVTTVPVDTFNKFQKYALRNRINVELDAEDAQRAEKEAIKAEAEKKQRFADGIVGLSEQKPDYSSKETDPKVAAEYLQEQYADNHDQLIKLVNGSRSDIKEQIDNIRKRIVEAEDWLDTNADLEPEQAQSREDKLKLAKEQLEDLTTRYDNWNKIRSLIMTEEEKRELKDERTANIKKVGIDKEALTVTDEREVPVLTDEELKKQYPTMDEASDYILSQRKEISKTQEELHRQLQDIDARLNQYLLGESDLTDEEIRDFNTTKADLEARMANLSASAKDLIAQNDSLKKLYKLENQKAREEALNDMSPAEQRRVKAEQYLNDRNISGLAKLYSDTSVDFMDDHPYTVDEYVASSIGRHALNYEGREVNGTFLNGLQQEFGGTRKDLEKIQVLAAEGKGQTFDKYVNGLYDNLPDNLRNQGVNTQEIRNSLLALLRGAEKYSDLKNYILKEKIAHAEEEMRSMDLAEEEQRAAYEEEKEQQMQEQVGDVSAKYSLSSETAGNGEQFYQDSEGNIDLANVPQEVFEQIGYTAAPFRLTPKMIKHMMDRHNTELKFSSPDEAIDFVRDVMNNFDHVRLGYDGALVFSIEDGRRRTGKRAVTILINNDNGKFYGLKTSGYESVKGLEKRPLLWERGANEKTSSTDAATASVTTSKSSLSSEQSGSASHQGNDLNSSGGKDTNNSDNLQEKGTKFSEKLQNAIAETETEPTEAQKKAGNYKKGHLSFGGYDFTVETPKGVTRSGKDEQGKPWSVTMHDTYGYILGKIGVDGDHIDMFINDGADLDTFDGNVYVVDQVNPETGEFDEHKVMFGYPSEEAATEAYLANYSKGWKGLGKVTSVPKTTFDKWLESSDRKTKPFDDYAMIKKNANRDFFSNMTEEKAREKLQNVLQKMMDGKFPSEIDWDKVDSIYHSYYFRFGDVDADAVKYRNDVQTIWNKAYNNHLQEISKNTAESYVSKLSPFSLQEKIQMWQKADDVDSYVNHNVAETISNGKSLKDDFLYSEFHSDFYVSLIEKFAHILAEKNYFLDAALQKQAKEKVPMREKILRDVLIDVIKDSGIEVVTDNKEGQKVLDSIRNVITVYHGAGASFDRFDHSFMGSGEGAQAFGWGTYLTEVPGIANEYSKASSERKLVSPQKLYFKNEEVDSTSYTPWMIAHNTLEKYGKDFDKAFQILEEKHQKYIKDNPNILGDSDENRGSSYLGAIGILKEEQKNPGSLVFEPAVFDERERNLYVVEIPKDNGDNYFNWDFPMSDVKYEKLSKLLSDKGIKVPTNKQGSTLYNQLAESLNSQKEASLMLSSLGFVGIKYPANYRSGGRKDGALNYVIFQESDAKIYEDYKFFRSSDGTVYGFVHDGKIYIDPSIATSEVPIHEYTHIWSGKLRSANPKEWDNIISLMKGTTIWNEVKNSNENLKTDSDIADEVLALYSGRRGSQKIEAEFENVIKEDSSLLDKAKAMNAIHKVKQAINKFWKAVTDFFHVHFGSADEVADTVLRDFLNEVNPLKQESVKEEVKLDNNLPFAQMNMDALPFHRDVKEVKPSEMTEAQKVAFDAVSTMLKKAGIPVKVVSNEDMEKVAEAQDNLNLAMLLNHPEMRFKIKTPEEKQAAENAYNFAKELRPNKWAQYAVVDMSNPNKMPEYYQKQELARKERTYLNRLMWGNYKVFNLDKSFEDNVAGLTGSFPSEFDPYKIDEQTSKKNELKKQIKETEDAYNSTGQERNNYQIQLMKEYMDEHGLASENDIPDDVWREFDYKAIEKYQDKLDSLFAKYKDLDRQLKAIVQPGVRFLRTYHGTGASFSEFDFDHMGEGAGSQVFGWGGYVTSSKKIGKSYATLMDNDPSKAYYRIQHSNGTRFAKKYPTLESFLYGDKQIAMNDKFTEQEKIDYYNEMKKLAEPYHNLYEVDIPDDNGSNYLDWDKPLSKKQQDAIREGLEHLGVGIKTLESKGQSLERTGENVYNSTLYIGLTGTEYDLPERTKGISKFLSSVGFTGIKYKAGRNFGGAKKGDTNYVIFKPEDMKIVDRTKFAQNKGVVYGYTDGKEIVLNQEHLNPNTPIHEYQHLWRTAAKEMNPELIAHGDELIKQTQLFRDLKEDENYKHLSDDEICDEAFARLTGEDGAAILEQMAKDAIKENPLDTAKELTIINRLKNWLKKFWYWTLDTFTKWKPEDIQKMTLEDIRNLVLRDLAESRVLWNRFRGDSNSLGENQGSALTPSANNPSGKDSVLNPHSDAKIRNNIETAKGNGGNLSVEDKIKAVSQQFGVDEADVAMYANAIKKGSTAEAARARANIKRHLLQANEDKISSFKELLKYTKPVNEALKENFGDVDAMIEERKQQMEAQRNAMEAARKRAEEEEAKRKKHLEELSLIPDDKLDKQYMDALAKGDDATAREMLDEAARRKGYEDTESAYQGVGAWAAPGNPGYESDKARRDDWESSGSDVNLEDMALGYTPQPDDYFSHPERYSQNTPHGLESVKAINTAIDAIKNGEKDVRVKVYRAVPTSVKEGKLRNGDWVTPSKKYAEMHGTNRLDGKYRIIEDEVPATQLWWDGNDANEFGFDDGKEYKYKNAKNNRKLNDLVTYDDEGDVIPPSKRFNSRKSDVRFHRSDDANLPSEEDNKPKKKTERGRIDEATGAFKLAPNGEQSNLSKKQYIEARTKNFKDWFGGDWEKKPKDFKNKLDANGEPLEKYVEGYLNRPKKPTMPKKRKGEDEATFFGRKMLYSQALEDWPKTEADWKKRIDEFDENTLAALTPPDEEAIREKYQKQYENDMASWRKDHPYIKEGEERPLKIPDMRDYQSIQDYGEALGKHEIWKTAPNKDEYERMAEDEIISKVALMDAVQHPFSEYARLKTMKAEFLHMRHVMQNQKVYDQNTTDAVVQFAKRFMSLGYGDDLGRGSINTLLTIVKNSTGKKSYEISQHLYQVMDVLMNNQLRNFDRAVMKTMSIKELKENAKGIQVQGKLELRGQTTIKAFRDAVSSRISSDKLDEKISNLIGKMAADKKNASSYQDELLGLNLAKQYVDYIDSSRNDAIEIEDMKRMEIEGYKNRKGIYEGELTKALLQEHVERLNQYDDALFNNKVERMERYSQLLANLGGMIDESVKGAREFQERDARRAIKVKMMASADLGGKSMNQHHKENWKTRLSNSDVVRLFCSPLGSFDALMREFGSKQINGEGQLWNHFVRGAMKASNDAFKSVREANNEIDLKVSELFGKVTEDKNGNKKGNMTLNDLYALERSNKVKSLDVTIRDIEGEQTYKLQQGNLMYIYMVNKMPDGAMKLRQMGILDADVERIKENIDPRFLKLADWIQGEFLPKMRTKYNKRHEELFGAPMPMVENYFPLRVLKNARYVEEDVNNTSDGSNALPSTATGAIIKRKINKLPLDILNADALSVTIDNINEMENWYNYAPIRKDANTLLSDTAFRNRVQNMTTIYGSGERLWNNVKDATAVAMGTYRPKGGTDLAVSLKNFGKGITGAKISFRLYTAFKQVLSAPMFLPDVDLGRFVRHFVHPYGSFKWAIENLPNFDKRWSGRKLGDTVLMDDPTDWKLWHTNLMEKAAYYGMTPNALVDAVTCAVGARAVYDTKYKQYIKYGLTEERAKEKALSDAEINFNTSQQSSEGAFVSPMQLDRTLESAIFTPFRNSSMLYERKGINALRNLKHRFKKGHKEASIKFMAGQLMEEGVGYEQATKAAEKMYQKGLMHNIADAIVSLWLGAIIWNLGGNLGYLMFGDDNEKKKKMVIDAVILGLLEGPVDGLAGGQFINTAIANTITSDGISLRGLKNVDFSGMPMLSDFNSMIEKFGYDKVAGAQDLMFMVMQSGTGFNPKTLTDAINACIDYGNGDMTNAKEIALFVFRLMNGPAATVDNLYIDELGMKGKDAKKLSYEELAKRYAEYKFGKNTFGLGKLYSDEEKQKKLKAIEKSFDKKVSERLAGMDREDLKNEFSESRSQKEKKLIGKIIADELETKDSEAVKKAKADASYLRQRNFSDLMDDLYLQKEWETTNAANAGLEELKGNGASEEEIETYKTKHKADLDKRKAIQKARKEMQKKKADISSDNDEATMAAIRKLRDSILKTVRQTKK